MRSLKLARLSTPRRSERATGNGLPAGRGNPNAVSVHFPAGVGGGDFATYWPFNQGLRAQITQGPGGSFSHYTIYTRDAVDVGVPTGTLIRAGFTGVIARVNTGCRVGQLTCGNGYGNYIYLKASDGTCAVMAHMSQISVSYGQQIEVYAPLGLSGGTGNVSGPHLHYDHVNCSNNQSLPWAPIEGGSLQEGATITSQNHPPGQPCTSLQGGCAAPIQGSTNPLQGSSPPLQGGGPGAGGGSGTGTVTLTQGPAAPSGYRYAIALSSFSAHQSVSIVCYDSASRSGFYSFGLTTDASGNASTSSSCYSGDGPDHWVVANGVQSNHVSWGAGFTPTPPPPPTPTPMPAGEYAVQNASGGIYWRSGPDWNTAEATAGNGFYPGTTISVSCYRSGAANVPGSTDSMWEQASWVSGPGSGRGWINEHFINDGAAINQPSPGVPHC
ncbi:MAG: M23 family metallopeptidase [Steroidobacteraceae bacterium]